MAVTWSSAISPSSALLFSGFHRRVIANELTEASAICLHPSLNWDSYLLLTSFQRARSLLIVATSQRAVQWAHMSPHLRGGL